MGIARHLIEKFEKTNFDKKSISILVNDKPIDYDVYVKPYLICNKEVPVYNFKIDITKLNVGDHISLRLNKPMKFEYYDSDECTCMVTSKDMDNYYSVIAYDSNYDFGSSTFISEDYPYAFSFDKPDSADYYIIDDPNKFKYEIDHVINIWFLKINKNNFEETEDEIFDSISDTLL